MSATTGTPSLAAERQTASAILARLDRLPATRHIWLMVTLLSLGGMFEFYDLFMTGYVVPGLVKAGMLTGVAIGMFSGPALFVASTFFGLFIGTFVFGFVADKYGRRAIFTFSMLAYCAATLVMAFQTSGFGVCLWRLIAGIGIGVELVTIDTYVAELVPKHMRGRAFAFNQCVQFSVVPVVALLAYILVPQSPLGWDGWRWVVAIGAMGRWSSGSCAAPFRKARAGCSPMAGCPRPRRSPPGSRPRCWRTAAANPAAARPRMMWTTCPRADRSARSGSRRIAPAPSC